MAEMIPQDIVKAGVAATMPGVDWQAVGLLRGRIGRLPSTTL